MATLCYFPSCSSISSRKLFCTHHRPRLICKPIFRHFIIHASATPSSRRNATIESNKELCNDIREFLATLGLPEDHVPSTKELLQHGRKDLANIVRRKGHKLIRDLLASSSNDDSNVDSTDKSLIERLNELDDCEDLTGQNVEMDGTDDNVVAIASDIIGLVDHTSDSDTVLNISSAHSSLEANNMTEKNWYQTETPIIDDGIKRPREGPSASFDSQSYKSAANGPYFEEMSSGNLESEDSMRAKVANGPYFEEMSSGNLESEDSMRAKVVWDVALSSDVPVKENQTNTSYSDSDLNNKDTGFKPLESAGLSMEQRDSIKFDGQDDSNDNIAENVPSNDEACIIINADSSANLSLEKKVAKFTQSGDLDPVEVHLSGITNGNNSDESKVYAESEYAVEIPLEAHSAGHFTQPPKDDTALAFNGNLLTSKQVVPSATMYYHLRGDHMPAEDVTSHFDTDLDGKATEGQDQCDIDHLKFKLDQKELELSRLKQQIEKEKLALSLLQTKAETEISIARKHVFEKVAELTAVEESLPGLKEVQIQFYGNADVVELTGSFNGWHHRIKMDPQPATCVTDSTGLRTSRLWSTVLWLYPGVYEIKFIVDGCWKIDPQRETVTRGHICNNIVRVD